MYMRMGVGMGMLLMICWCWCSDVLSDAVIRPPCANRMAYGKQQTSIAIQRRYSQFHARAVVVEQKRTVFPLRTSGTCNVSSSLTPAPPQQCKRESND
ncbi:hypothetical protein EJ06DRAFT_298698 [Trichodelitschia bisporula]|uniref:Secreted protein n=1 Tax=Trichodelitschia bisporula TaxID=703511 RepID=A0A6G1I6G3_9PEZI|nr:hypothetical protein EJ06DRAFT_298698 [Trichodelitschia bisporula]